MSRDHLRVGDAVQVGMSLLGVSSTVWKTLGDLSAQERVSRIKVALQELESIDAPAASVEKEVLQSLFACCWTVCASAETRLECREALLEVSSVQADMVGITLNRTLPLLRKVVQSWQ